MFTFELLGWVAGFFMASASASEPIVSCNGLYDRPELGYGLNVNIDREWVSRRSILKARIVQFNGTGSDERVLEVRELPRTGLSGETRMYTGEDFDLTIDEEIAGGRARITAGVGGRRISQEVKCRIYN